MAENIGYFLKSAKFVTRNFNRLFYMFEKSVVASSILNLDLQTKS